MSTRHNGFGAATYFGISTGVASPNHRYRQTDFTAKLIEPSSGRSLWVGAGQISVGGALFVGDATSAFNAATAMLNDIRKKGAIGKTQS